MTYEQWWDTYNPIKNHIEANASFDGAMFETYGPELSFVREQDVSKVWTIIEGDDGNHMSKREIGEALAQRGRAVASR